MTDAARLQALEDKEAIRQLFSKYAEYLDAADYEGYVGLFAKDGVFGESRGHDALLKQMNAYGASVAKAEAEGRFKPAIHLITNIDIELAGDTAKVVVIWNYVTSDPDEVPVILQMGRYNDDMVREDGAWKIANHRISRIMGRRQLEEPAPSRLQALEARVLELEDKDAITKLMIKAQDLLDQKKIQEYGDLFTEDGVWCGVVGRGVGPKGITAVLGQFLGTPWASEAARSYHTHVNNEIYVDGDTARSLNRFTHMFPDEKGDAWLRHCGIHDDRFRRTADGWKFTQRAAYSELPYNPPHFQLKGPATEEEIAQAKASPDGVWERIQGRAFANREEK